MYSEEEVAILNAHRQGVQEVLRDLKEILTHSDSIKSFDEFKVHIQRVVERHDD